MDSEPNISFWVGERCRFGLWPLHMSGGSLHLGLQGIKLKPPILGSSFGTSSPRALVQRSPRGSWRSGRLARRRPETDGRRLVGTARKKIPMGWRHLLEYEVELGNPAMGVSVCVGFSIVH